MSLGVSICCTPALSLSIRQTLPSFGSLLSRVSSRFSFSSRWRSKETPSNDSRNLREGFSGDNKSSHHLSTVNAAYAGKDSHYELGVFKPVKAYIGTGKSERRSEDGVHLRYDLQQESFNSSDDLKADIGLHVNQV